MQSNENPRVHKWQRLLAVFGSAGVILIVGLVTYGALRRAREARDLVAHTHLVIETVDATFSALQDAETGQRGYVITGIDSYLAPYRQAFVELRADTTALRQLTRSNPREQAQLDTLAMLIGAQTSELREVIDARTAQGFVPAANIVRTGRGKETMDTIRRVLGEMQTEQDSLIASRQAVETRRAALVVLILLIGTLVAASIGLLINAMLARYGEAQEQAASALSTQNEQLQEQALELELQQQHLQDQASELEVQNEQLQEQATELEAQAAQLDEQTTELETSNDELQRVSDSLRERTDEAERASRAKSEFLAAMSHELRTPLNAIVGYVDLLAMEIRGPTNDVQQEDLRRIKRSSHHLLTLINEILDLARVETGQIELHVTSVPMAELLGDAVALIAPQMARKAIAFDAATCDAELVARIDAERTRQILLNLLTNAQKFTDSGGRVSVDCVRGARHIGESGAPVDTLCVRVIDSGRGIATEKLHSIFEPFVQVDRRLTPDGEQGLGLGLSISRDLARAMGGDLTVESVVGRGSTFTLHLPAADPIGPPAGVNALGGHEQSEIRT